MFDMTLLQRQSQTSLSHGLSTIKHFTRVIMDKLKLTGLNLGRVFNYRGGRASAQISTRSSSKQPNLELKTRPKQVLGSLPLVFPLLGVINSFIGEFDTLKHFSSSLMFPGTHEEHLSAPAE